MKFTNVIRYLFVALITGAGSAQTRIDLRTQAKSVDFSAATSTLPSQTGAVLPATCQVGATFVLTATLAGQNWYICTSANQWTLQGATLPSMTGNSGALLSTTGSSLQWNALAGDISGAPGAVSVKRLLGRPLNAVTPSTGQFLEWDGAQWSPQTISLTIPVTSIFGRTGAVTAQTGDYNFSQISGSLAASQLPQAGGDLSGTISSATVTRIQSLAVSDATPATGQVLTWSGSQWSPQNAMGGISSVFGRTGPITAQAGDYSAAQITNAADVTQPNSYLPGAKQTFTGSVNATGIRLTPGPLSATPQAGDVAVDSGDSNRIKLYSGAAWVPLNPSIPPSNYTAFFTNAATVSVPGATHGLGTGNLIVQCYDNNAPANMIEPSQISVESSTYNVMVTFATAQTGRCVINGYNGASGTSPTGSGAGMASQLGDLSVIWNTPATLTIGGNCSPATPCNVRFANTVYSIIASAMVSITGGNGIAFIYVDATGNLIVGSNLTVSCTVGCIAAQNITGFPVNSVPIYTWTSSSGSWDPNGGSDRRGWLSANPVLGGPGIAAVTSAGQTVIGVDSAVVPTYLTGSATLTFSPIAAGTCSTDVTFPLPGANSGDAVAPGWPASLAPGVSGMMRVTAGGVIAVRLCADNSGAASPGSATYAATVVRGF